MNGLTIYEFDTLAGIGADGSGIAGMHEVPANVFSWLEAQCLHAADAGGAVWLRWAQRRGHRVIQVTSFVGVIRAPDGFQIEVLPKIGKAISGGEIQVRQLLIDMLCCLHGFRHIQINSAKLCAARMPLLEVFISEFLRTVEHIVKRGLRSDYYPHQDNLFALRGKLMVSAHLRQNLFRADRFFTAHNAFSANRPENRLLHAALHCVLRQTGSHASQKLARELDFALTDVPPSTQIRLDFQQVRRDRSMGYYADALAWARLILDDGSPLTGSGHHMAPSLLFPMEAVFEAYVARHLPRQLATSLALKTQARSRHLVRHCEQNWFRLQPDLLVADTERNLLVLDTKWKLLDTLKANGTDKYGLSQSDFYQLQAYGLSYLDGTGEIVLIYPRTDAFTDPLPVFDFPKHNGMKLWVLPFCLKSQQVLLPECGSLNRYFLPHVTQGGPAEQAPIAS